MQAHQHARITIRKFVYAQAEKKETSSNTTIIFLYYLVKTQKSSLTLLSEVCQYFFFLIETSKEIVPTSTTFKSANFPLLPYRPVCKKDPICHSFEQNRRLTSQYYQRAAAVSSLSQLTSKRIYIHIFSVARERPTLATFVPSAFLVLHVNMWQGNLKNLH